MKSVFPFLQWREKAVNSILCEIAFEHLCNPDQPYADWMPPAFRRWTAAKFQKKEFPNFLEFSRFFSQNNQQQPRRESAMSDEIMTLKEVAEYLKLKEKTAYRHAAEGILPGFKVGGAWRFRKADIDAWIEKNKNSIQ